MPPHSLLLSHATAHSTDPLHTMPGEGGGGGGDHRLLEIDLRGYDDRAPSDVIDARPTTTNYLDQPPNTALAQRRWRMYSSGRSSCASVVTSTSPCVPSGSTSCPQTGQVGSVFMLGNPSPVVAESSGSCLLPYVVHTPTTNRHRSASSASCASCSVFGCISPGGGRKSPIRQSLATRITSATSLGGSTCRRY
mgnify:CR=1 FL=1